MLPERDRVPLDRQHPWPGLISFAEIDRTFFCGRDREISDLARQVLQEPLTVLFGKSGLGKSSMLRAGLAPVLREQEFIPIYIRLDHTEHVLPLEDQVERRIEETLQHERIEAPQPVRDESLWEYFHKKGCDWWDADNRLVKPVLIFDQFEELLTIGRENPVRSARADAFLTELEDLVENRPPALLQQRFESERGWARHYDLERTAYRVVLALREDYLADLEALSERLRSITRNRFRLLPMSGRQALDVIRVPGGHLVDDDVALRIVDFVSRSGDDRTGAATSLDEIDGRQVEPALLSVVLRELNNRRLEAGSAKITAELVGEGQATEILDDFYERGLHGMSEDVRDFIVECLLTSSGARNRIAEEDALTKPSVTDAVIATLIDRRILQRQQTGSVKWLELTHDTLAAVVSRDRTEQRQRRELAAAAAREAAVQRELRRTRRTVALVGALLVATLAVAGYALSEKTRADKAAAAADREKNNAESAARTAEANLGVARDLIDRASLDVTGGAWSSTAAVVRKIEMVEQSFQGLGDSALTAEMRQRRARFLAQAANAMYDAGHIREGVTYAARASAEAGEEPSLARVEALQARARGLEFRGQLSAAERDLALAESASQSRAGPDFVRVRLEGKLLRARIAVGRLDYSAATAALDEASKELEGSTGRDLEFLGIRVHIMRGVVADAPLEALRSYRRAQQRLRSLMEEENHSPLVDAMMANVEQRIAYTSDDPDESLRLAQAARTRANVLAARDPENLEWLRLRGEALRVEGFVQSDRAWDLAGRSYLEAEQAVSAIRAREPDWIALRILAVRIRLSQAWLLKSQAQPSQTEVDWRIQYWGEAVKHYRRAQEESQEIARGSETREGTRDLILAISGPGFIEVDKPSPRYDFIDRTLREALATLTRMRSPQERLSWLSDEAELRVWIAYAREQLKRPDEAIAVYRQATRLRERVAAKSPTHAAYSNLSEAYLLLGDALSHQGNAPQAALVFGRAAVACDRALALRGTEVSYLQRRAKIALSTARFERERGNFSQAVEAVDIGIQHIWKAIQSEYGNTSLRATFSSLEAEVKSVSTALSADVPANRQLKERLSRTLTSVDMNRLLEAAPTGEWKLPPLMPGAWRAERRDDWKAIVDRLSKANLCSRGARSPVEPNLLEGVRRIRSLPLDFYERGTLYELETPQGLLAFVERGSATLFVNGESCGIHELNSISPPRFDTPERAEAYLRFFVGAIQADAGRFQLIDGSHDLEWTRNLNTEWRRRVADAVKPLVIGRAGNGGWQGVGTIVYDQLLFHMFLSVSRDGMVSMADDFPQFEVPGIGTQSFTLHGRMSGPRDWTRLINEDRNAVGTAQKAIDSNPTDQAARQRLAGAYLNLSWHEIMAGNYQSALKSTDTGMRVAPEYLPLQLNRAHALLFLGRLEEAEQTYRSNRGKTTRGSTSWESEVLNDFNLLEQEGHAHPAFARLREMLKGG